MSPVSSTSFLHFRHDADISAWSTWSTDTRYWQPQTKLASRRCMRLNAYAKSQECWFISLSLLSRVGIVAECRSRVCPCAKIQIKVFCVCLRVNSSHEKLPHCFWVNWKQMGAIVHWKELLRGYGCWYFNPNSEWRGVRTNNRTPLKTLSEVSEDGV